MIPRSHLTSALLCGALAALVPEGPRADTVEATSTTLGIARQEWRDGVLVRVVPVYEIVSVSAREIQNPVADDLEVVLSTWGVLDFASDRHWDNGSSVQSRVTGDLDIGYVRGELFSRRLAVRLGRQLVVQGAARGVHLDGADLVLKLPSGFGASAYVGSPVSSRFGARGGPFSTNPVDADITAGGRVFWILPGVLELGASGAWAKDKFRRADGSETHAPSRQDLALDARVLAPHDLTFVGFGLYSLYDSRLAEGDVAANWKPDRKLMLSADYRHVEPDLLLPRDSILSVFASDPRNEVGVAGHSSHVPGLQIDADYHLILVEAGGGTGHEARTKGTLHPLGPANTVGLELGFIHRPENGYFLARAFGAKEIERFSITLDLEETAFESSINGQRNSFLATATAGYALGGGWKATVAGTAGVTPYLERQLDLMAKVVYNQTYTLREVR